jgi:hypothetical protein
LNAARRPFSLAQVHFLSPQQKGTFPTMKRLRSSGVRKQARPVGPTETFSTGDHEPLQVARIRAIRLVHDAADILGNAMPYVPETDEQLYTSVVAALYTLERHLTELNH